MDLISLIIILVAVGVALYLINMIPMDGNIKRIIQVVAIVAVVFWLLSLFIGHIPNPHIGR